MNTAVPSHAPTREPSAGVPWNDRAARFFEDLRAPCRAMVRRAYGSTLGESEIEDIYSNAWVGTLRALESRQASMDDEEIRRYVFTAVAHQAGKEMRRRKRKPIAPLERATLAVDDAAAPDETADKREQSRITRDLLSSLPRRRRAVLLLRYGWGLEPAQVCELIEGLSPRAYRKEITKGVDELTQQMKKLESGTWCDDREPVLKVFAAGLADAEQKQQAEHHLSHCRSCAEFVGRLNGHLHDLGSAAAVPGALDLAADGSIDVPHRLVDFAERARDSLGGVLSRADPSTASLPAAAPKGAGAAGAGLIAKLAGIGAAGKAAIACLGGGAVATMCVVAAVGPLKPEPRPQATPAVEAPAESGDKQFRDVWVAEPPSQEPAPRPVTETELPGAPTPQPEPEPVESPPAPSAVQEFDLAPQASTGGSGSGGTSDRGAAASHEFGPSIDEPVGFLEDQELGRA